MTTLLDRLIENEPPTGTLSNAEYWRRHCSLILTGQRTQPTKRQALCLKVIKRLVEEKGQPPTMREIADGMGLGHTPAGIGCFLNGLEERGYLTRLCGRQRSITLIEFPYHKKP